MVKTLSRRKFNGKIYVDLYAYSTKSEALKKAKSLRKEGHGAIIIKRKKGYSIFYRSKRWK